MARWTIFFSNLDLVGGGIALEIGFDLPAFDFFFAVLIFSVSLRNLSCLLCVLLSFLSVFLRFSSLLHFIFSTALSYACGGSAGWRLGGLFEF